ncbi:MAG TPA: hypothetical protein VNX21_08080 [Candidatus Thermoplasmatota archaeon]|nr:hypothetical protein [Candidatus Thermoplasmatota archaeon]
MNVRLALLLAPLTLLPMVAAGQTQIYIGGLGGPGPSCTVGAPYSQSGDFVRMNGPGTLFVSAPCGANYVGSNPSTCCGTTTASVPAGEPGGATWTVTTDYNCCGGWPRFAWTLAGYSVPDTDFMCGPGAEPTLWIQPGTQSWGIQSC